MARLRIVVVGSGFAGTVLARALRTQGHHVWLCERDRHPRFALGESSTPLAALSLERLAERYGLEDLRHLAAYGRWLEHLPSVRRGLKRGFTFYRHRPGEPFRNGPRNEARLLVAASPADRVADAHWLRADVDAHLVERALEEGVDVRQGVELVTCEVTDDGVLLAGRTRSGRRSDAPADGHSDERVHGRTDERAERRVDAPVRLEADLVVDATGSGGFLQRALGIPPADPGPSLRTGLVFGHFEGVRSFPEVAEAQGAVLPPGPYPDERAAVHHLLDEGWMYVLPFDHGVVSAGFVVEGRDVAGGDDGRLAGEDGARAVRRWERLLSRYPTLRAQFADARPVRGIAMVPRLQRRLSRAAGERWVILPHGYCFQSPMFSTGIAWSLRAVERLARILEPGAGGGPGARSHAAGRGGGGGIGDAGGVGGASDRIGDSVAAGLRRYEALLQQEAGHLEALILGAYRLRRDFDRFASWSFLYFASVSFQESAERLVDPPPEGWAWRGFLGADDPVIRAALVRAREVAEESESAAALARTVREMIQPRNVAGLADPERNRLYPVDLEALVAEAGRLGLSREEVRRNLPRLRGMARPEPEERR